MCRIAPVAALSRWMVAAAAPPAVAQPLGVFSWQLSPYCNVLTLAATLTGPAYRLKGFDDQCGAGRAAVIGMAVLNDDGTVGLGLTVVTAPGAAPVHIDATLNTSTLSGTWRDHAGNTGAFVFNPGAPAGPPRPAAPALAQLQRRVAGNCGTGTFMQAVNPDGSVSCAPDAAGNGDITSVTAGAGLTGGGGAGDVSLAVSYAGPGAAATAARSDHTHALANASNTAVGSAALSALTTGADNTALGEGAGRHITSGLRNVALGREALATGTVTFGNTALGFQALSNATGSFNLAIGEFAGSAATTGLDNIFIASTGAAADHQTIRAGSALQQKTFIAGIRGTTTANFNAVAVLIDSAGQLGTVSSSQRDKEDIADMASASIGIMRLRPVTFRYRQPFADGSKRLQYGLIAEEVADTMPSLAVLDDAGEPESVKYHELPVLLLNEVQRLERETGDPERTVGAPTRARGAPCGR